MKFRTMLEEVPFPDELVMIELADNRRTVAQWKRGLTRDELTRSLLADRDRLPSYRRGIRPEDQTDKNELPYGWTGIGNAWYRSNEVARWARLDEPGRREEALVAAIKAHGHRDCFTTDSGNLSFVKTKPCPCAFCRVERSEL